MAAEKPKSTKSSGIPTVVKIGLGCIVVLAILGILFSLFAGRVLKRLIGGAIQNKTGVSTDLSNIEQGKLTFTDPKTGAKLDVGSNKVPDDFPKDFPVYPGSKVTSSLSGNQNGKGNGFWLTLSTGDAADKVVAYYQTNLKAQGWSTDSTIGSGTGTNWTVSKGTLNGYVTIDRPANATETTILIVLGEGQTLGSPAPQTAPSY